MMILTNLTLSTYRIVAKKRRTGETVEGTTKWDGLSSIYAVEQTDGTVAYVSVLDDVITFERISTRERS